MRHIPLTRLVAVLSLCLLGSAFPTLGTLAQDPAPVQVRIAPSPIQVASGGEVEFAVEVVEVRELYGFDVILNFDPAVVQVVDADPLQEGVQVSLGTLLEPGFAVRNAADNEAGRLQFAMTQLNPSEAKSGTGSLIVVKLAAREVDASGELTLEKAQLAQRDGIEIPSELVSGQIVVGQAPAGPTNTPLPTQPAGSPVPTLGPVPTGAPPTTAPEVTAMPPAGTPLPEETASQSDTPAVPAETSQPPATPAAPSTPVAEATVPGVPAPTGSLAPATATPLLPTLTPLPVVASSPTSTLASPQSLPSQVGPTVVAQVQPEVPSENPPGGDLSLADNPRVLLMIGIAALGLAAVAGVIIVALLAGLYFSGRGRAGE